MLVCDVWAEVSITAENLYIELSLICPSWFSAMLSQRFGEAQNVYFKLGWGGVQGQVEGSG